MGLRYIFKSWILLSCFWLKISAESHRTRRQESIDESNSYRPPFLLAAPKPLAPLENTYHPPIPQGRSIDSNQGYNLPYNFRDSIASSAATSHSVHQQLAHHEASGLHQGNKVNSPTSLQALQTAPAAEIKFDKEKNNKNDEYVVYYYYYYDNDTSSNNNLSLNFDDIPSLEAYDDDKTNKDPQKISKALANNANSIVPLVNGPQQGLSDVSSQARSAQGSNKETLIKADRNFNSFEDTVVQPFKPVSNIFRYGANEVPKFPLLPNLIVSEVTTTTKTPVTVVPISLDHATTQEASANSVNYDSNEDDAVNNLLDVASEPIQKAEQPTTITTTDAPTTTEVVTTTERFARRRPSIGGSRRRPSSFSSNRASTRISTSSSSTTTTTTSSTPTRRSFQGNNRASRPRPSLNTNRGRAGSRTTESNNIISSSSESSTGSTTTTARARFTSAPRRFQSSRSRSQSSSQPNSQSSSTTTRPPASSSARPRVTSRRPNLSISRNRPARPGFLRPRPGSEPEVTETTQSEPEETSPSVSHDDIASETDLENASESEETSEESTTTEASRFSALFRPRNRNSLGNRPRPIAGNRPSRS